MKSDKLKVEIDLLRDSLRNLFVVMFAIMSGEISLLYKIFQKEDIISISFSIVGILAIIVLYFVKRSYKKEIKNLLKQLEEER